jgi:nucleotide-binding universal stress UspA family protein
MYRSILVPLDGTRFGSYAIPWAARVAEATGATLHLVHVHHYEDRDPGLSTMPQFQFQNIAAANVEHDRQRTAKELEMLEQRAQELHTRLGISVEARVLHGGTADAVAEEARRIAADLVVMATHGRVGVQRLRHGSMAGALVSRLAVPMLCVHPADEDAPGLPPRFRTALVPLDGSAFSEQALEAAAPLFAAFGTAVTLLHVVAPTPLLQSGFEEGFTNFSGREQALHYLEALADRYEARIPELRVLALEHGEPAQVIASVLAGGEYDVAALATHGRSGLSRLLLGSVAENVLAKAWHPMLLVRPAAAGARGPELAAAEGARG